MAHGLQAVARMKPKAMITLAGVSTVATPFLFLPVGFSTAIDRNRDGELPSGAKSESGKPTRAGKSAKSNGKNVQGRR